jgi:ribosomal-protein-alanine N-acetyltransferase
MHIETQRLRLRRLTVADAPELFRTVGDPDVMKYWVGGPDKSIRATEQRIVEMEKHWNTHGFGEWGLVEKKSGQLIGFSGLHYIADVTEVNIGYAFETSRWRQGFGFETCRAILDFGFQKLGLPFVVAVIWPENIASIKLAEKLGLHFWKAFVWQEGERVAYRVFREENNARKYQGSDFRNNRSGSN